jgi:hypothetical protein
VRGWLFHGAPILAVLTRVHHGGPASADRLRASRGAVVEFHHGFLADIDGAPDDLSVRRQSAGADGAGFHVQFDAV